MKLQTGTCEYPGGTATEEPYEHGVAGPLLQVSSSRFPQVGYSTLVQSFAEARTPGASVQPESGVRPLTPRRAYTVPVLLFC